MRVYASEQIKSMQTGMFKTAKIYCQRNDGTENLFLKVYCFPCCSKILSLISLSSIRH